MLKKLKIYLRNWLLKDEITEMKRVIFLSEQADEYRKESIALCHRAANSYNIAKEMHAKCLDVGVDVNLRSPSWAVICVKGKPETVRFMELDHQGADRLRMFLKSMEGSCLIVDSPFSKHFFDWR